MEVIITLALIVVLFVIALGAVLSVVHRQLDKKEAANKAATEAVTKTLEEITRLMAYEDRPVGTPESAEQAFKYLTGDPRHMRFYWGLSCPAEDFFLRLKQEFDSVEVFGGKPITSPFNNGSLTFELTRGGSKAVLNAGFTYRPVEEIQGFEGSMFVRYFTKGLRKVSETPIGDDAIPVLKIIRDFTLFYIPGEDVKPDIISEIIESLRLEFKTRELPEYKIFEIMGAPDGSFYRQYVKKVPKDLLQTSTLDVHYMPFAVRTKKDGKFQDVRVKPSAFIPAMINLIERGNSISMGHLPGTAKTVLARHIITTLSQREDVNVFIMDASRMSLFSSPQFGRYANEIFDPEKNNIIFLDQAESVLPSKISERNPEDPTEMPLNALASKMLNLIDGFEGEQYGLSFLFVYNGDQKYWHPAFKRQGRLLNVNVDLLDVKHAQQLLKHIISTVDMREKEVDSAKFNNLCENPEGVSVADVYGCIVDKDVADLLEQELELVPEPTKAKVQPFESSSLKEVTSKPAVTVPAQPTPKKKGRSRRRRR